MHPRELARRRMVAEQKLNDSAKKLAQRYGVTLPTLQQPAVRDQNVKHLVSLEHTAEFLEQLANTQETEPSQETEKKSTRKADKNEEKEQAE